MVPRASAGSRADNLNIGLWLLSKTSMTHLYIVVRRKTTGCDAMYVLMEMFGDEFGVKR
jgi:hypothetical protein